MVVVKQALNWRSANSPHSTSPVKGILFRAKWISTDLGVSLLRKPQKKAPALKSGEGAEWRLGVEWRSAGNWVRIRKMCPSFPLPTISPSYKETWGRSQKRIRMRNLRPQVYQQLDPRGAWVLLCISQSLSTLAAHQVQGRGKSPWGIWQVKILQLPMI